MSTKAEDTQKNILDTARKHFLKDIIVEMRRQWKI